MMEKKETDRLTVNYTQYVTRLSRRFTERKPYTPPEPGWICSFMPGTVVEVLVKIGDAVKEGDDIVIVDAMKMKNRLKSHIGGKVTAINVAPGDKVTKGAILVVIS